MRAFCVRNKVSYTETSLIGAYRVVVRYLNRPAVDPFAARSLPSTARIAPTVTRPRRTLTTARAFLDPGGVAAAGGARMAPAEGDGVHQLSLGVMGRSRKENERRLPLHPQHLSRIPDDLRESIYLERDYGARFGMSDDQLKGWVAGFRPASSSSRSATSSCNPSRYS